MTFNRTGRLPIEFGGDQVQAAQHGHHVADQVAANAVREYGEAAMRWNAWALGCAFDGQRYCPMSVAIWMRLRVVDYHRRTQLTKTRR